MVAEEVSSATTDGIIQFLAHVIGVVRNSHLNVILLPVERGMNINALLFELRSKALPLGNTQIYLVFHSLIRTFAPVMVQQLEITLKPKRRGFHLVTSEIVSQLPKLPKTGIVNIFTKHTSCGLSINENCDPDVRVDMETIFNRLVPENRPEYEHTLEGADDMPAHAKSTLSGVGITIPITDGRLNLGTWQGIYFCEFRNYGGSRDLVVTIIGE